MTRDPITLHADRTMSVLSAIYQRRAVRGYTADPVSRDDVRLLLDAAVHAPTAMHLEPWAFTVVQDKGTLARISDRAKALITGDPSHHRLVEPLSATPSPLLSPGFNIFYDAGTLIVIGSRIPGPFAAADCWLAAQNLMLAATAIGYATCPIGFAVPALNDPEVKRWLDVPGEITAIAPIIVGVARVPALPQTRREALIVSWK